MVNAKGTLTALGGMTSHAAVVARGLGIPAVTGCKALKIDAAAREFSIDGKTFTGEDDTITIEGSTGKVVEGEAPTGGPRHERGLREGTGLGGRTPRPGCEGERRHPRKTRRKPGPDPWVRKASGCAGRSTCSCRRGGSRSCANMILSDTDEATDGRSLQARTSPEEATSRSILEAMERTAGNHTPARPAIARVPPGLGGSVRSGSPSWTDEESEEAAELKRQLRVVESLEEANPMLGLQGMPARDQSVPGSTGCRSRAIAEAAKNCKSRKGHEP